VAQHVDKKDLHRIVATCVIYKLRRGRRPLYLIKERSKTGNSPYPGMWEVVGGGLERKDYEARKKDNHDGWENVFSRFVVPRETKEEVGLVIGPAQPLGDFVFTRGSDDIPVLGMRYVARYLSGTVVLDEEATDSKWIIADEVGAYNLIGTIAQDIKALDRTLCPRYLRAWDWFRAKILGIREPRAAYF